MTDPRLHFKTPLRQTPFHSRVAEANVLNKWAAWGGYTTALELSDGEMEYSAIRNSASLYDLCPMVKYRISGADAGAYLNRLTIRNAAILAVGSVHYTAWCDDEGKLLDDGTLFRWADTEYMLCCQERHLPWLLDTAAGFDVAVAEITEEIAALSLQGPCSASVLNAAGFDVKALKPFRMARFAFDGGELTVSRTGFTGDLGYELWIAPDHAVSLWDKLMEAGAPWGIRPIGTHALDTARIEAGFIVANADFIPAHQALREDRVRSPFEMALDWMIDWDKGHFNGRRALVAERNGSTSKWALVGLDIDSNVSTEGSIIYHDKKREVGHITAATWSPATKRNIAIAQLLRPYHDQKSDNLWVEVYALRELQYAKLMLRAKVTPRPFFNPARRRATPPGNY
ncbi:MAG: aminomethyltransferase family protein [Paracoccaceae bacterium]|nr:aminomethyltransferase family protein [Paracoccaceae bacterium]MDH5529266.1 aminomethyltransferase family protein [Paracoccaceae bacterium]